MTILKGDCIEVMRAIKPNSIDAVVTDPPYGLEFMGKEWDKLWDMRGIAENKEDYIRTDGVRQQNNPISYNRNQPQYQAGLEMQLWHTQWLTEAYRVLKPGGSMLVMGGTRTFHRLMVAIEDTGFIIKDTLMWVYGSGFPKAQDLGKMIDKRGGQSLKRFGKLLKEARLRKGLSQKDVAKHFPSKTGGLTGCVWNWEEGTNAPTVEEVNKLIEILNLKEDEAFEAEREIIGIQYKRTKQNWMPTSKDNNTYISNPVTDLAQHWDGFKVGGIKPAYEPIVWCLKPPEGSYIDNVLKWGVGAVNVDECRVKLNKYDLEEYIPNRCGWKNGIDYKQPHAEMHNTVTNSFGIQGKNPVQVIKSKGRFPANVILSHHPECEQVGAKKVKGSNPIGDKAIDKNHNCTIWGSKSDRKVTTQVDSNGYETVESWKCHSDCAIRIMDEQSGERPSGKSNNNALIGEPGQVTPLRRGQLISRNDSGGASRFFYCAKSSRTERNKGLDNIYLLELEVCQCEENMEQVTLLEKVISEYVMGLANQECNMTSSGKNITEKSQRVIASITLMVTNKTTPLRTWDSLTLPLTKEFIADVIKMSQENGLNPVVNVGSSNQLQNIMSESQGLVLGVKSVVSGMQLRISVKEERNIHPTCKPLKLFEYLIKLVTRKGQIILDPFLGSGTTAIAAHKVGRECVGIEREDEYVEIAKRRIEHWQSQPQQQELRA